MKTSTDESSSERLRAGLVLLDAVLCTEELNRRPPRHPDYEAESRALAALVEVLSGASGNILQKVVEIIRVTFRADSAGLSLLSKDGLRFQWPAIAGE